MDFLEQIADFFQSLITVLAEFFSRLYDLIVSIKFG